MKKKMTQNLLTDRQIDRQTERQKERRLISLNNTLLLKGICSCMVLITHLHGRVQIFWHSYIGTIFAAFGYLAVAVFFFLSGYGLTTSYKEKGKAYLIGLPRKKILPFYCLNCLLVGLYLVVSIILHAHITPKSFFLSFGIGSTIITNGWYIQVQLILYVAYYIVFKYQNQHRIASIVLFCVLFCCLSSMFSLPSTWYESIFAFPMGVVFAFYEDRMTKIIETKRFSLIICSGLSFCLTFILKSILGFGILSIAIKMISALTFVTTIVIVMYLFRIESKMFSRIGVISLEIYVLQGVFLDALHSEVIYIQTEWLYCITVVMCTVAAAYCFHPLVQLIYKKSEI